MNQDETITKVVRMESLGERDAALLRHLITQRFPGETHAPYIAEWARRIKDGSAEARADGDTLAVLHSFETGGCN